MFVQADEIERGSVVHADMCIVGAGAAGITLALSLMDKGKSVVLLDGGGFDPPSDDELSVYDGEAEFMPYLIRESRLRYFGGTTNHWGGWCRPLDPVDFRSAPDGWPFPYAEMAPYYARAAEVCELRSTQFGAPQGSAANELRLIDWDGSDSFQNKCFQHSPPTRFGQTYRDAIGRSEAVRCILGANAVGLARSGRKISRLSVATFSGHAFEVESTIFVLAMGGIENARFLLQADGGPAGAAIGNDSGTLGTCFADHFTYTPGILAAPADLTYDLTDVDGSFITPIICPSDAALAAGDLPNCAMILNPSPPSAVVGNAYLDNAALGLRARQDGRMKFWEYKIHLMCAPTPDPASRITLSDTRDRLGMRTIRLDWRIEDGDFIASSKVIQALALAVGTKQLGRLRYTQLPDPTVKFTVSPGMHHLGTTRMSADARHGVVDASCRVHDTDNLFVAGSSVFPTFGFANPTLTIVALALRLADTIQNKW